MEKIIPLSYLKFIAACIFSYIGITTAKELIRAYLDRPQEIIQAVDCKHVIAGERPFMFHGKIVHQEHFEINDYQIKNDRPPLKFNAVFVKSDEGKYLMMYTKYSESYPPIDGNEVVGWFVNHPEESWSGGFSGIAAGKIPASAYVLS